MWAPSSGPWQALVTASFTVRTVDMAILTPTGRRKFKMTVNCSEAPSGGPEVIVKFHRAEEGSCCFEISLHTCSLAPIVLYHSACSGQFSVGIKACSNLEVVNSEESQTVSKIEECSQTSMTAVFII